MSAEQSADTERISEKRLAILERFGDGDTQDLCAEIRRLRVALQDILLASRDDGLAAMCNWMRGRAAAVLQRIDGTGAAE